MEAEYISVSFQPTNIKTTINQGLMNLKTETAKYITDHLPNCISKLHPKEGHLSLSANNFQEIFKDSFKGVPYTTHKVL